MDGNGGIATENIDGVILRLLKLQDGDELSYQTYFDRLKKRLAMARMGGTELPSEEDQLLRDELKRIRGIADKTERFRVKVKIKNNNASGFSGASYTPPSSGTLSKLALSIKPVDIKDVAAPPKDNIYDILVKIDNLLESILDSLSRSSRLENRNRERSRIRDEESRRGGRERELESRGGFKSIVEAVKKIMAPFQSIWDRIVNFFVNVLLGKIAFKFFNWLADKKNASKVESIIRFLTDWWPALVAGYLLFGTSFGRLITRIIPSVTRFIFQLGKVLIPRLLGLIKNPYIAIPAAFIGLSALATQVTGQAKAAPIQAETKAKAQTGRGLNVQGVGGVGDMGPVTPYGLVQGAAGGGLIRAFKGGGYASKRYAYSGGGTSYIKSIKRLHNKTNANRDSSGLIRGPGGPKEDKIPAMLSDGEFVMSAAAVRKHGVEKLEAMNAAAGGTNIPTIKRGAVHAAGGGLVGEALIKKYEGLSSLTPGKNDYVFPGTPRYNKIDSNKTPIHAYLDSKNIPTIGWGTVTLPGNKTVKMGDVITKNKADQLFTVNYTKMFNSVSRRIPHFNKMSDKQKSAIMSLTYNAGEGWYGTSGPGAWPSLTKSIASGDWRGALKNWEGSDEVLKPRRAEERRLFAQGPASPPKPGEESRDASSGKPKGQNAANAPAGQNIFQQILNPIQNIFRGNRPSSTSPSTPRSSGKPRATGFAVGGPVNNKMNIINGLNMERLNDDERHIKKRPDNIMAFSLGGPTKTNPNLNLNNQNITINKPTNSRRTTATNLLYKTPPQKNIKIINISENSGNRRGANPPNHSNIPTFSSSHKKAKGNSVSKSAYGMLT